MIRDQKRRFDSILPDLLGLYKLKGNKSTIKHYEGIEGIKTAYESLLRDIRTDDPYYIIAHQQNWYDLDPKWFEDYIERRPRRALDVRAIFQDSEQAQRYKEMERVVRAKIKIFSRPISLSVDMIVCPQRLILHNFAPPITTAVIEHEDIINFHLNLFRYMWDSLPDAD